MSDQPLFQNADEQEAAYAPQQLPADSAAQNAADLDDHRHDAANTTDDVGIPAAGAGLLGQAGGGLSSGVVGGAPSAIGPAVSSTAPEDDTAGNRSE